MFAAKFNEYEEDMRMTDESITISLSQFNQMCKEIEELRAYKRNAEQQEEKCEYEHGHAVVEAYNDGKTFILDKIRAEIEALYNTKNYLDGRGVTVLDCLKIMDKYKGE